MNWIVLCLFLVGLVAAMWLVVASGRKISPGPKKVRHSYFLATFVFLCIGIWMARLVPPLLAGAFSWIQCLGLAACLAALCGLGIFLIKQGRSARV